MSQKILDIAKGQVDVSLPDDLEKVIVPFPTSSQAINPPAQCVCTWFCNFSGGNATQERPGMSKAETCGHPTSLRMWTTNSMCSHLHAGQILDEQKLLSDNSEKDIGKYHATLAKVFEALSDMEQKEDLAVKWNTKNLLDDVQQK